MGEFGIGIKCSQQTFQEHELIKRGTQAKEQELTLQSYITPQRNGEHKKSQHKKSQTANNSTPQWEELHDWELEMVVGGFNNSEFSRLKSDVPTPKAMFPLDVPTRPSFWGWWRWWRGWW